MAGYRVEALAAGLAILGSFTKGIPSLSMTALASSTGLSLSRVFRLVATLEEEGYLERLESGLYQLGVGSLSLGFASFRANSLISASGPWLERLNNEVGHTVALGVLSGDDVLYLAQYKSRSSILTINVEVGYRIPAIYDSKGKVLLAHMEEVPRDEILSQTAYGQAGWGPCAVPNESSLRAQLSDVIRDGYGCQIEEVSRGVQSIAAPIFGASGNVVAAANVAVPLSEMSPDRMAERFAPLLMDTCSHISSLLGFSPSSDR